MALSVAAAAVALSAAAVALSAVAAALLAAAPAEGVIITYQNIVRRGKRLYCKKGKTLFLKTKMNQCPICYQSLSRRDVMLRH